MNHYALALHGGADVKQGRDYSLIKQHLAQITRQGAAMLMDNVSALDVE